MSSQSIHYQLTELGDDPSSDAFFHILSKSLQPGTELSMDATVQQITALLPEGKPYSVEMADFLSVSYEVAEQIYDDDTMNKLVTIIELCYKSSKFPVIEASNDPQTDPALRFGKVAQTCRAFWDTTYVHEDAEKYVNFQAFVARLYQRRLIKGHDLSIWVIEDALDKDQKNTDLDAYTKAAANYLIVDSPGIYEAVDNKKWRRWRKKLAVVANSATGVFGKDTIVLVGQAMVAMDAVKQQTGCTVT